MAPSEALSTPAVRAAVRRASALAPRQAADRSGSFGPLRQRIARGDYDFGPIGMPLFSDFERYRPLELEMARPVSQARPSAPRKRTPAQARRLLRNGLIHLARAHGYSHRQIATALSMAESVVYEVLKKSPLPTPTRPDEQEGHE